MVLFDRYGRFGYLLNTGKYYEFQPIEITDPRSSVRERSVPVEYKRSNIILSLPEKVVVDAKAATVGRRNEKVFEPVSYRETISEIRELLDKTKARHDIKSTEMDWYKNASRALEHLYLVHGFDDERITKYIIYHYLDSANYRTKRSLFEEIIDERSFKIDQEIETHIAAYFRASLMRSKDLEGIYIADREDVQLLLRDGTEDWKEGDKFDAEDFKSEIAAKYLVDMKRLNDVVGYAIQFKDQDMSFYYKDIHSKRNRRGRKCDRSGGKVHIIEKLNRISDKIKYTEDNTSTLMYSGSLCVVMEMIIRKYHDDRLSNKIYYLTPEQAIYSKIIAYSTD
jgi:hypothetical protein